MSFDPDTAEQIVGLLPGLSEEVRLEWWEIRLEHTAARQAPAKMLNPGVGRRREGGRRELTSAVSWIDELRAYRGRLISLRDAARALAPVWTRFLTARTHCVVPGEEWASGVSRDIAGRSDGPCWHLETPGLMDRVRALELTEWDWNNERPIWPFCRDRDLEEIAVDLDFEIREIDEKLSESGTEKKGGRKRWQGVDRESIRKIVKSLHRANVVLPGAHDWPGLVDSVVALVLPSIGKKARRSRLAELGVALPDGRPKKLRQKPH